MNSTIKSIESKLAAERGNLASLTTQRDKLNEQVRKATKAVADAEQALTAAQHAADYMTKIAP